MSILPFQRLLHGTAREAAPGLLQAILVLALAVQGARLLWIAFSPPPAVATLPAPTPDSSTDSSTGSSTGAPVLARHGDVFHPRSGDDAQATGFTVLGLRVEDGGGSAILGRDGLQAAYRVGDEIADGVTLAAVAADHVVVRAGGRARRIALVPPSPSSLPTARPLPVGAAPEPDEARRAEAGEGSADTAAPDSGHLLAATDLRPRREGGRVTGYTVVPRGNEAALRQAGLQAGDVLLAVDGQALDPGKLDDLKRQPGATATLTVRRGDQTRTLTLQAPR